MNLKSKTLQLAMASTLTAGAFAIPATASAGTSASVAVSNMYLWRGVNVATGGVVSGSLDYSHDSGFYAGVWGSSEGGYATTETDLYFGFGGEVSGFSYDISYWNYLYPERLDAPPVGDANGFTDLTDSDAAEVVLSLGYGPVNLTLYTNVDSDNDDNNYITLGFSQDKFSVTLGAWDLENPGDEYTHVTFGYAATDEVSFALNFTQSDTGTTEEDPLFQVTYAKSFDIK